MINILSYTKPLDGYTIKKWIKDNTLKETEYTHVARRMIRFLNIKDGLYYSVILRTPGTGCGERRRYNPIIVRAAVYIGD